MPPRPAGCRFSVRRRPGGRPKPKRCPFRDTAKIEVRGDHDQVVPDTELRQKRIDRSDLNAVATAAIAQLRGLDVVLARWSDHRQRAETIQDAGSGFRSAVPCNNSWSTTPVVWTGSPPTKASRSRATSAPSGAGPLRKARDHTLVSTNRVTNDYVRACSRTTRPSRASRTVPEAPAAPAGPRTPAAPCSPSPFSFSRRQSAALGPADPDLWPGWLPRVSLSTQ